MADKHHKRVILLTMAILMVSAGFVFDDASAGKIVIKRKETLCPALRRNCETQVESQYQCKSDVNRVYACESKCPTKPAKTAKACKASCKKAERDAGVKCVNKKRAALHRCTDEFKQCRKEAGW